MCHFLQKVIPKFRFCYPEYIEIGIKKSRRKKNGHGGRGSWRRDFCLNRGIQFWEMGGFKRMFFALRPCSCFLGDFENRGMNPAIHLGLPCDTICIQRTSSNRGARHRRRKGESCPPCNPSFTGGAEQVLLWPGGSGGSAGSIGRDRQRPGENTHSPQGEAGGLGPRLVYEETSASWFQADRPDPQAGASLSRYNGSYS